jgi:hypothetical protein
MESVNQVKRSDPNETKPPVWEDLGYANFE